MMRLMKAYDVVIRAMKQPQNRILSCRLFIILGQMERGVDCVMTRRGGFAIVPDNVDLFSLIITAPIFRQTTSRPLCKPDDGNALNKPAAI